MTIITLADLPPLTALYRTKKLERLPHVFEGATSKFNDKISLIRADITTLKIDSIVNAANESLLGGGGVDGVIHAAAGRRLVDECDKLNGCATGSAKITAGYNLPSKHVIHAVGPVYRTTKRTGDHAKLLRSCYLTSLDLADQNDCRSIAFPAISTGVYGYPSDEAAEVAIDAVKEWLEKDEARSARLERIIFCSFLEKDEVIYKQLIPRFFPPAQ